MTCPVCHTKEKYSDKFDAYYCEQCNVWSESKCDDPICDYCTHRPAQPIQD
jgi:hypothetical protein